MNDWSLRLALAEDANELPAIERAAADLFANDPDCAKLDFNDVWEPDELRALIAKGHCLVTEVEGKIVGFLVNQPYRRELHIWEMDVHPDYQQRGIGAGLIRACQIDARNMGFSAITLTTFRDLPWNGPFYARLGFVEIVDFKAHTRLAEELAVEVRSGLPESRRCAMIYFIE